DIPDEASFINTTPHMTFVRGKDNVEFLRRRWERLSQEPLFADMEFSDDHETIGQWAPQLIKGRNPKTPIAATWSAIGTDVDFGAVTRALIDSMVARGAELWLDTKVRKIKRGSDGLWRVNAKRLVGASRHTVKARFV